MKDYIGDSVYGDYSTGDLRLYTDNGDGPANEIILTGDVLTSMFKFIERCLAVKITVKPAAQNNAESVPKSDNKPMPKLPTLEEVQKEVQSRVWGGGFVGTSSNITEIVYSFISRQLSA